MTLDRIRPGQKCRILQVSEGHNLSQRLMELGLLAGVNVEVVRLAPFGDPMELILRGYHLSLRKSEASLVEVEAWPSSR